MCYFGVAFTRLPLLYSLLGLQSVSSLKETPSQDASWSEVNHRKCWKSVNILHYMLASHGCTINIHATEVFFAFFFFFLLQIWGPHGAAMLFCSFPMKTSKTFKKAGSWCSDHLCHTPALIMESGQKYRLPVSDTKWQCSWPYFQDFHFQISIFNNLDHKLMEELLWGVNFVCFHSEW